MRVCVAALFLLGSAVATPAALADTVNFSFSFTGTGLFPGTVTGEIDGLQNNATSAATAVYIDSATNNGGNDTLPYDVITSQNMIANNSFTVSNGVITSAILNVQGYDPSEHDFYFLDLGFLNDLGFGYGPVSNDGGLAGVTYVELTAAPEPGTLSYLAEALSGAAVVGWRGVRHRTARRSA